MAKQKAMKKCKKCSNLGGSTVGDFHVHGWLESDPTGALQNTMESIQTSWICQHCSTRWLRLKMKLSGSVRWTEVEFSQPAASKNFINGIFSGLI
jgi:hypothetical protein